MYAFKLLYNARTVPLTICQYSASKAQEVHNVTPSALVLKNYGNLPAHFRWQQKNDPEKVICKFEPASGVI